MRSGTYPVDESILYTLQLQTRYVGATSALEPGACQSQYPPRRCKSGRESSTAKLLAGTGG